MENRVGRLKVYQGEARNQGRYKNFCQTVWQKPVPIGYHPQVSDLRGLTIRVFSILIHVNRSRSRQ